MRVHLWLSDHAWDSLSREANTLGWIRQINSVTIPGNNSRNLNRFFEALSILEYTDTRPEHFEGTCVWSEGERCIPRHMQLDDTALALLASTAAKHRIPPRWYAALVMNERIKPELDDTQYAAILANRHTTPASLASAALEAIGLRYLSPPVFPLAPHNLFKARPRSQSAAAREQRIASRYGF